MTYYIDTDTAENQESLSPPIISLIHFTTPGTIND
jgi:hypothetical protein